MAPKRIVLCFDGTYIDTRDTPERLKPGSTVSRICRWLLPPLLWQLLWVLRVFAVFKAIEHFLWPPRTKARPPTNVSLLATAIKPVAEVTDHAHEGDGEGPPRRRQVHQLVYYVGGIGALGNPQSRVEEAVTGNTMAYKIRCAYWFLVDSYVPGDDISSASREAPLQRGLWGIL